MPSNNLVKEIQFPSTWTKNDDIVEIELEHCCSEYKCIYGKLSGEAKKNLSRITRVQNPYLYGRYILRKAEYETRYSTVEEKLLVHATAEYKVSSIIEDNLDWRLVSRCKFGKGVSFSPFPEYANKECARSNGDQRAMIFNNVLIHSIAHGNCSVTIPPASVDTTTGNQDQVYVKYYDDEFYPAYVAYYTNTLSYQRRYFF